MKRFIILSTLLLLFALSCKAQKPRFYLGFDQILDNREYFTPYAKHQTFFGARINPGASFTFDSVHQVHAGINYMYEYGGTLLGVMPQVDLYYSYRTSSFQAFFGSFPRREIMNYTLFQLTDSLNYYRPNMEGASISYQWTWGMVHGWVDWTGRATEDTRESILAGVDATFMAGPFRIYSSSTRYHLARSEAADDNNRIRDDGSIMVLVGMDLSGKGVLDRLEFSTGMATTYMRARPADTRWSNGWYSQIDLGYSIAGIKGVYYLGDPSPLLYGDRLFGSGNYGRMDLYVDPFRNPRISSRIAWNFHFLPGDGLYFSQQLLIHITL